MRPISRKLSRFLLSTLVAPTAYLGAQAALQPRAEALAADWKLNAAVTMDRGPQAYDSGSIMVKFLPGTDKATRESIAQSLGGTFVDRDQDGVDDRFCHIADGCWAQIDLARSASAYTASSALTALEGNPHVAYVQLNNIIRIQLDKTPNDPSYSKLWGMTKIQAPAAWETTTGSNEVVVGVIDTGILWSHPDLKANMWVNPREIAGNGKDDDNNGYIDDVYGINAITGKGDPIDTKQGHGTHCSGTIGAVGNNSVGVAGVNWNVKLVGMKFLGDDGNGTDADAAKCMNYAIGLKKAGVNMKVLSNSWGGPDFDQALLDSIKAAEKEGMLFVAAAGNGGADGIGDNNDNVVNYPSNYDVPNILAIASTTSSDARSGFSNYGPKTVDMGAPGSDVYSTYLNNSYSSLSGTSMATPHVAGAAALLLAKNPNLTYVELKSILMDNGDPISALAGKTVSGKRLNVKKALDAVSGNTDQLPVVSNLKVASAGPDNTGALTFSTDATDDKGVSQVDFYVDGGSAQTDTTAPYAVTLSNGLANGSHTVKAVATDTAGQKSEPVTVTFTVGTQSDTTAPTVSNVNAAVSGTSVTLSADATDNVGVKQVVFSVDGNAVNTDTTAPYSYVLTGVAAGSHTLSVTASDAAGNTSQPVTKSFTVSDQTGSELIKNGGFEEGTASWNGDTGVIGTWEGKQVPYEGQRMAYLGGNGYTSTERIYQPITIPANATSATLTFMLHIDSSETYTNYAMDTLKVSVVNTSNTILKTLATYSNMNKAAGYQKRTFDISAYKGQTVWINFRMNESALYQTSFVVDNVSVQIK